MGAQMQRRAYSRVCGASTAKRSAALGYAGAGPAQRATDSRLGGAARRQDPGAAVERFVSLTRMSTVNNRIAAIQQALREAGLDGWLFYDFRGSDPLAARILKLDPQRHMTRRWYYLIPAQGVPKKLLHRIEPHSLDDVPGESRLYLSWQEQHEHLKHVLASLGRSPKVAMQYSPLNAIPYISRVDAGTIELVRSLGVEVVTSADLVQRFEAVWTKDQYASHCEAAAKLRQIVDEAFARVREEVVRGATFTERDLQQ